MTYRGNGDRRFNDWHYTLPKHWWYIDLDGVEACSRCRQPLLLYEITRNPQKATTILRALAGCADLPAVLVLVPEQGELFTDDTKVVVRSIRPVGTNDPDPITLGDWRAYLMRLRAEHDRGRCVA